MAPSDTSSIGALRRAYETGQTTVRATVERALARLADGDQDAVWIHTVDPQTALAEADALDAARDRMGEMPLFGVLYSVKDNIDVVGMPTTAACPGFSYRADRDATVVARVRAAGAICLGKTNMDQFATGLVGTRSPYGVPKNPFNADAIPGGSSSGAGVSVSTGVVGFAFGTDTGGSGRVPASYNGIFGLKPAPGDWSRTGLVYACRSFDTPTVFASSLEDVCAVDEVVRGPDPSDGFSRVAARQPLNGAPRIALPQHVETFGDQGVADLFAGLSAHLGDGIGRVDLNLFRAINDLMFFGPFLAERDVAVGAFIDAHPEACDPVVRGLVQSSKPFSAADAWRALYAVADCRASLVPVWEQVDVVVTPTVGAIVTRDMVAQDPLGPNFNNGYYTNFANPLGLMAVSVPVGHAPCGTPWGVTLYAVPERFAALIAAAKQVAACATSARRAA